MPCSQVRLTLSWHAAMTRYLGWSLPLSYAIAMAMTRTPRNRPGSEGMLPPGWTRETGFGEAPSPRDPRLRTSSSVRGAWPNGYLKKLADRSPVPRFQPRCMVWLRARRISG